MRQLLSKLFGTKRSPVRARRPAGARPRLGVLPLEDRLVPSGFARTDFNGDGKADPAVYRPSTNYWYALTATGAVSRQWGQKGDIPIMNSDFDGDHKADIAIFRPSNGQWWILKSSSGYNAAAAYNWGQKGDIPIQNSDFDGDGKADLAVFRPSTGQWWILTSGSNFTSGLLYYWGAPGDVPLQNADFDGDGRADLAVFRPSNGTWYVATSGSNFTTFITRQWGYAGDVLLQNTDFDGDHKADMALFRPSNGMWYILTSSSGFNAAISKQWGQKGDVPLANTDFDGDGKADMGLFRPSNGTFYVLTSSSGYSYGSYLSRQFGQSGDLPVPSADYDGDGCADITVYRPGNGKWYTLTSSSGYSYGSALVRAWGAPGDLALTSTDSVQTVVTQDAGMVAAVRFAARDGVVDRQDMLNIYDQVRSDNWVSSAEFTDLKSLDSFFATFGTPQSVHVLEDKVIAGNPANQWYTGGTSSRIAVGNLQPSDSATRLTYLEDKWFLGLDRPMAMSDDGSGVHYTYAKANGALFGTGIFPVPWYGDVHQGSVGDCYFMGTLAEIAQQSPLTIANMFTDNGDGTFTVRFFRNGVADYVTVDRYLPVDTSGNLVYANEGHTPASVTSTWVALAEKAYAQLNEEGWTGQDGTNSYDGVTKVTTVPDPNNPNGLPLECQDYHGIGWGDSSLVMAQVAGGNVGGWKNFFILDSNGNPTTTVNGLPETDMLSAFEAGKLVTVATSTHLEALVGEKTTYDTVGNPTFYFQVYDPYGSLVHRNPNDPSSTTWLTYKDLCSTALGFESTCIQN
jgi:hypothetical protein